MAKNFKNKVGAGNPILNTITGAQPIAAPAADPEDETTTAPDLDPIAEHEAAQKIQAAASTIQAAPEAPAAAQAAPATTPKKKPGKPKTRGEIYRINLALDADLAEFLKGQAWAERKSVTELLNDLVHDYKKRVEG